MGAIAAGFFRCQVATGQLHASTHEWSDSLHAFEVAGFAASGRKVWRDSVTIDFMKNTNSDPDNPFRYVKTPARLTRTGTAILPDKRH